MCSSFSKGHGEASVIYEVIKGGFGGRGTVIPSSDELSEDEPMMRTSGLALRFLVGFLGTGGNTTSISDSRLIKVLPINVSE